MLARRQLVETELSLSEHVPAMPDRRASERYVKILRVGTILIGERRELCLIRNVSAGGLMAHVYSPLEPDQRVIVELKTNQQVAGKIVWVDGGNVGMAFDRRVEVADLLTNPRVLPNGWRPRLPRVEVDRLATLRIGARTYWVHARDVSQGGVKIETDQPIDDGAEVVITLERFRPLAGTVRWQEGRICGVAFNELIPFEELINWLKQAG